MSIFAFCAFLPREFERNRTLSKKTIYRLRKLLGWCIIKLKIRLRIFLYTPVLCLWSSDDRNDDEQFDQSECGPFHGDSLVGCSRLALENLDSGTRVRLRHGAGSAIGFLILESYLNLNLHRGIDSVPLSPSVSRCS